MNKNHLSAREWGERIGLALLFVAIGFVIIFVFSPFRPVLSRVDDYLGRIGLIALLLVTTIIVRRSSRYEKYWPVVFGLFVLALAVSLDWVFGAYLIDSHIVNPNTPTGFALLKVNELVVVACVVIACTKLSGSSLGSIYIQKGNLRLGLTIGLIAFFLAAAGSIPMSSLFNSRDLTLTRIMSWLPWILIFVLANASLEELLFRGLFLRKLEPFYWKFLSNFLIVFVFTALHKGAGYAADEFIFLAVLVPLALAWGYITQKTDGLWGSILFHAGMDIPIMLGIFSNLT
jgi:membrane protease YdiL (CAAX protease family)